MNSDLFFDGKKYISSKRAAQIGGYSDDYLGQLCREKKLECRMIGRNWYVYEESLVRYQNSLQDTHCKESDCHSSAGKTNQDSEEIINLDNEISSSRDVRNIPAKSNQFIYSSDDRPLIPVTEKKEENIVKVDFKEQARVFEPIKISKSESFFPNLQRKQKTLEKGKLLLVLVSVAVGIIMVQEIPFKKIYTESVLSLGFKKDIVDGDFKSKLTLAKKDNRGLVAFAENIPLYFKTGLASLLNEGSSYMAKVNSSGENSETSFNLFSEKIYNNVRGLFFGAKNYFANIFGGGNKFTIREIVPMKITEDEDRGKNKIAIMPSPEISTPLGGSTAKSEKANPKPKSAEEEGRGLFTVASDITRREVIDLIKQSDDRNITLLRALLDAPSPLAPIDALSINQSISNLSQRISAIQYSSARQMDKPASVVTRADSDIENLSNVSITSSAITVSSFSGTTGTFTGLFTGANGTFSGALTVGSNLTIDTDTLAVDATNNRVGIATSSPTDTLSVNGPVYLAQISAPSATTNRLYNDSGSLYWDGNLVGGGVVGNWTLSGGNVYRSTGNVGIASTSPSSALSVTGNGYFSGSGFFGGAITGTSTLNITGLTTLGNASTTQIGSTGSAYFATSGGNVGIGTTSPNWKLSVAGIGSFDDYARASYFTATSTTATSTFAWGVEANALNITSTIATSTFANGIQLSKGCILMPNGTCLGTGGGTVTSIATNNGLTGGTITTSGTIGLNTAGFVIGGLVAWDGTNLIATGTPQLTVGYLLATSTTATTTFAGGLNVGSGNLTYDFSSTNIGVGTLSPARKFSIFNTSANPQLRVSYDGTNYGEFTVSATGDMTIAASGGDVSLLNENLRVCADDACQTTATLTGNGNLTVENNVEIGGSYNRTCATGYIWVPGSAKFGTLPGFCVMKYEAKNDGSNNAVSTPTGSPYVSIDQPTSRTKCEAIGLGYHLISEPEWMTIAENIAQTPINDTDTDAGLQLATGHSDNGPASALATTAGADPVVTACNLSSDMENAANDYTATCQIRGTGSGGSTDNDKGYYGTGQTWSATGYSAGAANKAQLRTHILSNGSVIWDIAGNVWEWTDAYINGAADRMAIAADSWQEWSAVTDYNTLGYTRPQNPSWSSANGIGKVYVTATAGQRGFIRGGAWNDGVNDGVFTLHLGNAPSSTNTNVGFRCVR